MVRESTAENISFEKPASPTVSRDAFAAANSPYAPTEGGDTGQDISTVQKYLRARGLNQTSKNKNQIGALALLGGVGQSATTTAINTTIDAADLDDNTRSALETIGDGARFAAQAIGPLGYAMVGAQAAFVAAGVRSDAKARANNKSGAPRNNAAGVAKETTESGAKTVTKEVAEAGTEKAARVVAKEATETGVEAGAKAVAGEAGARAGGSLFGRILGGAAKFAKKIPVIGAAVTAGFVAYEIAGHVRRGDLNDAFGAAAVGTAEIGGSFFGFVGGDFARTAAREGLLRAGVIDDDVWMGDIQSLVVAGKDVYDQFNENAPPAANSATAPIAQVDLALRAG